MDFRFTDEQEMIARTLEEALADVCTTAHLREMINSGQTHDTRRWNTLASLGISGALLSEGIGGLGLGEVELCRVAECCGAALLPEPMVGNAGVALPLLAELAEIKQDDSLLQQVSEIASGDGYAVLFHPVQSFANGVFSPAVWWIGLNLNRSGCSVQILQIYS